MPRGKQEALCQIETDETLELGMEFLKASSGTSTLAARYLILLERIQTRGNGRQAHQPGQVFTQDHLAGTQSGNLDPILLSADGIPWQRPQNDDQPTLSSDLVGFDDLLFGTGLPRELLSTDWSVFESL